MCILFLAAAQETIPLSRLLKLDEKMSLEIFGIQFFVKTVQFTWQIDSIYTHEDHNFWSKNWFLPDCNQKFIHKIVVSDFWKYIESIDVLYWIRGDIHWISSRESLQNWHPQYVIII